MADQSISIRTEATKRLLQQIDGILDQWRRFDFSRCLDAVELEQVARNLDRARRQFDSKLFFVVIFGPLKAGKSTLTNTLAGRYVSPTGFGKETTRRPSLIIRAEQEGIDQFFGNDLSRGRVEDHTQIPSENDIESKQSPIQDAFDDVADVLRGLRKLEDPDLKGRFTKKTLPLTKENLELALTEDLNTEPLLTVIRCDGSDFLKDGVVIVDMPGLDGNRTNWQADPIHGWVIKQAEFFLFVQSSVAALNSETHKFLRDVVNESTKPPIWLVQNLFDACHWRSKEEKEEAEKQQRDEAKKRVDKLLPGIETRPAVGLNVGLVWDAREKPDEKFKESEFSQRIATYSNWERDFRERLHSERFLLQERNYLKKLKQKLDEEKKQIQQVNHRIEIVRQRHKKMRDGLCSAERSLDAVNYRRREIAVRNEIATMADTSTKSWWESLKVEVAKLKERLNQKMPGKVVNDKIASIADKLGHEGYEKYFAKPPLLPQYIDLAHTNCETTEKDAIKDCENGLKELDLAELPQPLSPSTEDLPPLPSNSFSNDKLEEKQFLLFDKKYGKDEIEKHIDAVASDWRQQIDARNECWKNQLLSDHFSTYCMKRRQHYRDHFQQLLSDFEAKAKPEETAATAAENLIGQMNEALRNLELPMANADASTK